MLPKEDNVVTFPLGRDDAYQQSESNGSRSAKEARSSGIALTKAAVKKLELPPGKDDVTFWDNNLTGFGLRIRKGGKKTYFVQFRDAGGSTRKVTIGSVAVIEADDARAEAKRLLGGVATGNDPAKAKREAKQATKFGDLVDQYLLFAKTKQRPSTHTETTRNLKTHAKPLHTTSIRDIDRATVARLHEKLTSKNGPVLANRVLASLSSLSTWAIGKGHINQNPVIAVPKNTETARERVLSDEEIRKIWQGTGTGSDYDRVLRLLLLTGLRRSEVGDMRWEELSGDVWTVPAARMKGKLDHEVPLTKSALSVLPAAAESGAVFGKEIKGEKRGYSGWSRSKARLDGRLKIDPWGLHDFRRTMSTRLHDAGVEPHIVETLLAHISGHKAGVAGRYNKANYRTQKREALQLWADLLQKIIDVTTC